MSEGIYEKLREIRHYLHQHPVSENEFETTAFIKSYLKDLSIETLDYPF